MHMAKQYEVILDEEYSGMGHDLVLRSSISRKQMDAFMDEWAANKARHLVDENDEKFTAVKNAYHKQLSYRELI